MSAKTVFDGHGCPSRKLRDSDHRQLPVFPPYQDQTARLQLQQRPALRPGAEASLRGKFSGWEDEGLASVSKIFVQYDHEDAHARG
jgi:hypothetical protein